MRELNGFHPLLSSISPDKQGRVFSGMPNRAFMTELSRNHRHNSWWNTADACFFQIAFTCSLPSVIIVVFLKHYTNSQIILNMPVFIGAFTNAIMPLLMSFISRRLNRKKKAVIIVGTVQRVFWISIVLVVAHFSGNAALVVPLFFASYLIYNLLSGSNTLFWQEFLGRALLPEKFSNAMGIRDAVGRLFGFATSFLSVFILGSLLFPANFLVLFLITFVGNMGSIVCHLMIKEAPYDAAENRDAPGRRKNDFLQPLKDRNYRWYLLFIVFIAGNLSIGGIYTNLGIERFKSLYGADRFAGILGVLTMCSGAFFSFLMGRFCEKAGVFKAFVVLVSALIIIPVLTVLGRNVYLYLAAFFLNGIAFSLLFIDFATVLRFGDMESRHSYLSLSSIIKLIPIVLFANIGGYLADRFSPELTLLLSAAFCCPGLLILLLRLKPFLVSRAHTPSGIMTGQ